MDAFEKEPPGNSPLFELENVVATPLWISRNKDSLAGHKVRLFNRYTLKTCIKACLLFSGTILCNSRPILYAETAYLKKSHLRFLRKDKCHALAVTPIQKSCLCKSKCDIIVVMDSKIVEFTIIEVM